MTLTQLHYFIEVYKAGSMHRASTNLHVSQSTISVAIQNLEKELGVTLFDRRPHQLTLTTAGMALYIHATEIIGLVEKTQNEMKQYATDTRLLRFGMTPVLSLSFWAELTLFFEESFPRYTLQPTTKPRSALKDMLLNNTLDIAILPVHADCLLPKGVESVELGPDEVRMAAMSVHHPLASKKSTTLEELSHCTLLGYENSATLNHILEKKFASIGKKLVYKQLCPQISTLISLLRKNIGIAFLDQRVIRSFEDLTAVPIADIEPPTLYLVWRKASTGFHMPKALPKKLSEFFKTLREVQ